MLLRGRKRLKTANLRLKWPKKGENQVISVHKFPLDPKARAQQLVENAMGFFSLNGTKGRISKYLRAELMEFALEVVDFGQRELVGEVMKHSAEWQVELGKRGKVDEGASPELEFSNGYVDSEGEGHHALRAHIVKYEALYRIQFFEIGRSAAAASIVVRQRRKKIGRRIVVKKHRWPFSEPTTPGRRTRAQYEKQKLEIKPEYPKPDADSTELFGDDD
jgi:hypothetical protein